ncbi:MAG: hypothetical protein Kow006_02100 [Gammaproteobacteria bacterium]
MERTLLLVDDEENIVRALARLFRRDGYHILRANSGQEGLELLAEHPVGVIVSDQRMPQMTGVEFLRRVKELYPDTVRIVLSGYTELESITSAINEGAIYKFLTKPWDDDLLRKNIREAFEQFEMAEENRRLTEALRVANTELSELNRDLEERVREKTREVLINLRAAQISQEVLEHLPVAVLGIDTDGTVVIANRLAQSLLAASGSCALGDEASEILPVGVQEVLSAFPGDAALFHGGAVDCNGTDCEITVSLMGGDSAGKGLVVMLRPPSGEAAS